tara:strand:+ start:3806 stop:4111 length:306 start_codon:yes stop_codon:yes gene_type:complete
MHKQAKFMDALASIGQDFQTSVQRATFQVCLFPPKPFNIAEKQRAQAAMQYVKTCNRIGILSAREYQREMARVSRCIKDALFAHRLMVKGNTAAQTFGGAV